MAGWLPARAIGGIIQARRWFVPTTQRRWYPRNLRLSSYRRSRLLFRYSAISSIHRFFEAGLGSISRDGLACPDDAWAGGSRGSISSYCSSVNSFCCLFMTEAYQLTLPHAEVADVRPNLFRVLNENLTKCAFYAAFLRTRNWVLVTASRCALSSR